MADRPNRDGGWDPPVPGSGATGSHGLPTNAVAESGLRLVEHPPRVFISYRRADVADEAAGLSSRLKADLTAEVVYRDADPFTMLPGDVWTEKLGAAVAESDASIFLIGEGWPGYVDENGMPVDTPRIQHPDDDVRQEVESTLARVEPPRVIPVFVGLDPAKRQQVAVDAGGLLQRFDELELQRLEVDRGALTGDGSVEYQQVLVSVWVALKERNPGSILVVGDADALVDLDRLVDELVSARRLDRSSLSRFASGAYLIRSARSRRRAHRFRQQAPDVIIAVSADDPTEQMISRVKAVVTHPYVRRVAFVAVGSAAAGAGGVLASQAASWGSASGTTVTTSTAAGAIPSASAIGGLTVAGKVAAATVALGGTGVVASAVIDDGGSSRIEISDDIPLAVVAVDGEAYPLGKPPPISVELSEPTSSPDLDAGYPEGADPVQRAVVVDLFGEEVEVGSIVYPTDWKPFADDNGPGEYPLDGVSISTVLPVAGTGTSAWCHETGDPSHVVAGWRLAGDQVDLGVRFTVLVGEDGVEATRAYVAVTGTATRVAIEPEWDFSTGTQCEETSDGAGVYWSSE